MSDRPLNGSLLRLVRPRGFISEVQHHLEARNGFRQGAALMTYQHLTEEERVLIAHYRHRRYSLRAIARILRRSPSTISREIRRNAYPTDGRYRSSKASSYAKTRRSRARRGSTFRPEVWSLVRKLLRKKFSPMQISGVLRRFGLLSMSHETIYQHVLEDRRRGGALYKNLRGAAKRRRKRYGRYDSRGRLAGKRPITERPPGAENRSRIGHWEVDTVVGPGRACILTLVERKTGYVQIAKLDARTKDEVWKAMHRLLARNPTRYKTITADNGCEFHGYRDVEAAFGVRFYFAKPYHSWERGTNENTNGLIRQYIPKRTSMTKLSQSRCDWIAAELNRRPRERHGFYTPEELFLPSSNVALHS
jgi:IS30 family transposase